MGWDGCGWFEDVYVVVYGVEWSLFEVSLTKPQAAIKFGLRHGVCAGGYKILVGLIAAEHD